MLPVSVPEPCRRTQPDADRPPEAEADDRGAVRALLWTRLLRGGLPEGRENGREEEEGPQGYVRGGEGRGRGKCLRGGVGWLEGA